MQIAAQSAVLAREVMESPLWSRVILLVLAITQAIAPFLAGLTGHGRAIGQSDGAVGVETPIVPAGYAFSIWGVIFLGCVAFSIAWLSPSKASAAGVAAATPWFIGAFLFCTIWSVVAQYADERLTLPVFVVLLTCLLLGLRAFVFAGGGATPADRLLVIAPVGVFAGWCSVAIFANTSTVLAGLSTPNFGVPSVTVSLGLLSLATLVGIAIALRVWASWWSFGAAAWALLAIAAVNLGNLNAGGQRPVAIASFFALALLAAATAIGRERMPA